MGEGLNVRMLEVWEGLHIAIEKCILCETTLKWVNVTL